MYEWIVLFVVILIFYTLLCVCVKAKTGCPPLPELVIAYKYLYLGKSISGFASQLRKEFPNHSLIKLCYCGPKSDKLEFALGVIISKDWTKDPELIKILIKNQLAFFNTPLITNALYSEYYIISWLPFTNWIALATAYMKHFRFASHYNLCAYPVMEILSRYKVSVLSPLMKQDSFVVPEAERLVYGKPWPAMLARPRITIPTLKVAPVKLTAKRKAAKPPGIQVRRSTRATKG